MRDLQVKTKRDYKIEDLVSVGGRLNNLKRPYIYINPLQGKHLATPPKEVYSLCKAMAQKLEEEYRGELLLVVGFAETATALGLWTASLASEVAIYSAQTTREDIEGGHPLYFTESHSHAPKQCIDIDEWDVVLPHVNRVVFVEDEVTTGSTILKAIEAIKGAFPRYKVEFSVISILNSMSEERLEELNKGGIPFYYIKHIPMEYKVGTLNDLDTVPAKLGGKYYTSEEQSIIDFYAPHCSKIPYYPAGRQYKDSRKIQSTKDYKERCRVFVREASKYCKEALTGVPGQRVLVIGTEEFMYPPLLLAYELEKLYKAEVHFQATTRSPIQAATNAGYPIHKRYWLKSLYDMARDTYLYNLEKYAVVFIVTDSKAISKRAHDSLVEALIQVGNRNIHTIIWEAEQ